MLEFNLRTAARTIKKPYVDSPSIDLILLVWPALFLYRFYKEICSYSAASISYSTFIICLANSVLLTLICQKRLDCLKNLAKIG